MLISLGLNTDLEVFMNNSSAIAINDNYFNGAMENIAKAFDDEKTYKLAYLTLYVYAFAYFLVSFNHIAGSCH
jgi:hypothetical protein